MLRALRDAENFYMHREPPECRGLLVHSRRTHESRIQKRVPENFSVCVIFLSNVFLCALLLFCSFLCSWTTFPNAGHILRISSNDSFYGTPLPPSPHHLRPQISVCFMEVCWKIVNMHFTKPKLHFLINKG